MTDGRCEGRTDGQNCYINIARQHVSTAVLTRDDKAAMLRSCDREYQQLQGDPKMRLRF